MSELQISLLGIGIAVVLAVYIYNTWVQVQYRRRYGEAFKQHHADALYRNIASQPATLTDEVDIGKPHVAAPARAPQPEEVCTTLHAATDYIVEIIPIGLSGADALDPLWHRRFDFGKHVYACGQNAENGHWEKVIPESPHHYTSFRLALQLVSRNGAVNAARLSDFRDCAREIGHQLQAEMEVPDVDQAAARAQQLDAFCAAVDQMIGINLLPNGGITLGAAEVAQAAQAHGMSLHADGSFHLHDVHGRTVYSLCNADDQPFSQNTFNHMRVKGLTLLLDVPRVEKPVLRFDDMVELARELAKVLGATLVDDHRVVLGDAGIVQIRDQLAALESRMLTGELPPGSDKALRLFA